MQSKRKLLAVTLTVALALLASASIADEESEALVQGDSVSESSDQEQGIPISLERFHFEALTNKLRTGDTRILDNFQKLQEFFVELHGPEGTGSAGRLAQSIDFSREVFVVVGSQPLDTCKRAVITALERIKGDHLKVTVEISWRKSCQPSPLPEKFRYQAIGMPIERPIAKVEVVYTSRIIEFPQLQGE